MRPCHRIRPLASRHPRPQPTAGAVSLPQMSDTIPPHCGLQAQCRTRCQTLCTSVPVPCGSLYTRDTSCARLLGSESGHLYDNSNDQFYLYLCEFPAQKESVLLNDLKKVCLQLAKDIEDTEDPLHALHQKIKTELDKAQKVPYFKKFTWDPYNIDTVKAWNNQGRIRPWRLDQLPRENPEGSPFFEGCPYQYEESTTKILSNKDLMMIMGLSFCRVHLHHEARAKFFSVAQGHTTSQAATWST